MKEQKQLVNIEESIEPDTNNRKKINTSKRLVVSGIFWSGIQMVVNQGFAFLIKLILARLLFPEQFGIIGMATVFTGFIQVLNDLGIGAALVQRKEKYLRVDHYHTAFWTGMAWSVFLYSLICFALAPAAASFYNEPLLSKLIPIIGIGILVGPVNLVNKAQLTKAMDFKKIAFVDNVSNISAGILSIILAFLGAGVWALAFNSIVSIIISMPLYFRATKWFPKILWEKQAFKDIFGFGVYTTGTNILNYIVNNTDYLLIGKLLGAQALGAYTFAFVLTDTFRTRLMAVVNNVMYPMYAKIQTNPEAIKNYYLKVVNYNSVIVYPIMLFMISLGEPFILYFFGQKWVTSIEPLRILSISVMVHMLVNSNTSLIRGMGRPDLEMKLQMLKFFIFVPSLFVGSYYFGVIGAAYAVLVNKIIAVIIAQYTFNFLLNIKMSTLEFIDAVKGPWTACIAAYLLVYLLDWFLHPHFFISALVLFSVYAIIIYLFMGSEIKQQYYSLKQG